MTIETGTWGDTKLAGAWMRYFMCAYNSNSNLISKNDKTGFFSQNFNFLKLFIAFLIFAAIYYVFQSKLTRNKEKVE